MSFETAYGGNPPWEIGRPQRAFVELAEAGEIEGAILDVGCGTGENALFFAARGNEVWGIDLVETAIARARDKAARRGLTASFFVGDALELSKLGRTFDVAVDSGLFHGLATSDRAAFADSVRTALRPGGALHLICFSELQPGSLGPHRMRRIDLIDTFRTGWEVRIIRPSVFETRADSPFGAEGARAWLTTVIRRDT